MNVLSGHGFARSRWLILVPLAVLYIASLPQTVQSLDSGELATSAWNLTVPHPPGYPTHVWLHWLFVRLVPWGPVYYRAALATSLLMLGTLALMIRLARDWIGVGFVAVFATTPLVFEYAILPDVFALNCAFAMAIITLAFQPPSAKRCWFAAIVFGLAAANHQSIIFVAPVLLFIASEERRYVDRYGSLVLGASLTVLAYLSLLLMDNDHVYSWTDLRTAADVLAHFARRDYGTLQLSGHAGTTTFGATFGHFAYTLGATGVAAATLLVVGIRKIRLTAIASSDRAWLLLSGCLLLYLVVMFPRLTIGGSAHEEAIVERFFLLPALLIAVLVITSANHTVLAIRSGLRSVVALTLTFVAALQAATSDVTALRSDSVIEDYARNLLSSARVSDGPSLLVAYSDTQVYAARYVQATEAGFENVYVVAKGLMFHRQVLDKLRLRMPKLFDATTQRGPGKRDMFDDFILPNSESYAITHVLPYTSPNMHTTILPLGRRVERGTGTEVARDVPRFTPAPPVYRRDDADYVETKALFAEYAIYDLALARDALSRGDRAAAKAHLEQGLATVPYCIPCLRNMCTLTDDPTEKTACNERLADLEAREPDYYK